MIYQRLTIGNDELCFRNPRAGEKRRSSSLVFSSPCGGTGSSLWVNLGRRCSATAPILPRALGRVRPGRCLEVYWATGSIWRLQNTLRQPEVTARKLEVLCIERMFVSLVKLGVCNEYHRSIILLLASGTKSKMNPDDRHLGTTKFLIGLVGTGNPVLTMGKNMFFQIFPTNPWSSWHSLTPGTGTGWNRASISTSRSTTTAPGSLACCAWWTTTWYSPSVASAPGPARKIRVLVPRRTADGRWNRRDLFLIIWRDALYIRGGISTENYHCLGGWTLRTTSYFHTNHRNTHLNPHWSTGLWGPSCVPGIYG